MRNLASLLRNSRKRVRTEQVYRWAAVAILCFGLGLRLMGLDKGIWTDEAYTLNVVQSRNFLQQLRLQDKPPLFYIFFWLWSRIGSGDAFMRLPSVFFGICTIAVVIKWLKPYSHLGSLLAGLYCATLPMMLRYSQELRGYSLLLLATALAFYCTSHLIREPESWSGYVGLGFSLAAAVATHFVGVMLLMSMCVFSVITPSTWRRVRFKRAVLALAMPLCLFIMLFVSLSTKKDASRWWVPAISGHYIVGVIRRLLGTSQAQWPFRVVTNRLPVLADTVVPLLRWDLGAIILYGPLLLSLAFGNWWRSLRCLAAATVYWGQMLVFSVMVVPVYMDRTALPGMIPFIGFAGIHIATTRFRKLRIALLAGLTLLCLIFAVNWIRNDAGRPEDRWREIATLLDSTRQPDDIVIPFPGNYAGAPLQHYVDLPSTSILPVSFESSLDTIEGEIRGRVAEMKSQGDPFAVFVVLADMSWRKGYKGHDQLVATLLESQLGEPSLSVELENLTLLKYEYHKP